MIGSFKPMQFIASLAVVFLFLAAMAAAQQNPGGKSAGARIVLGRLANGAEVAFVRAGSGGWGIEIAGGEAPRMAQPKPAEVQVYRGDQAVSDLAAGYESVQKLPAAVVATAKVTGGGGAAFAVEDRWTLSGKVLSLSRKVLVTGADDQAGFFSAIRLSTESAVTWPDNDYFAPGLLYGDPANDGDRAPGGTLNYRAKRFEMREDNLSAPLFAISFRDGHSIAVLDPAPKGDTTWAEATAPAARHIIDERLRFGALGARESPAGGIEIGFWMPGTTGEFTAGSTSARPEPVVRRRYHPVKAGFSQSYQVRFRFGQAESFRGMIGDTWRWAWAALNPQVAHLDLDLVRRTLTDHLEAHVLTVEDRAGVPFLYDAVTGKPGSIRIPRPSGSGVFLSPPPYPEELTPEGNGQLAAWARTMGVDLDPARSELWRWPKVVMGFVSKGIEVADQLLREADRDPSPRGQKMRESGLAIIASFVRIVPMAPPAGAGFDLQTGKPASEPADIFFLRAPSEGLRTLMAVYLREKRQGRDHPEWLRWCTEFAGWLIAQQREDGSFPRSWRNGTGEVNEPSGTSSYNPVPFLVTLSQVTGDKRYLASAIRAADYVWADFGSRGIFVGGTTDNPNVVDKEAGMLSLDAFLALYEDTGEPKWLEHAKAAASYTESWIWIWNVPMPLGADDAQLAWKHGVPTVGVQGISARGPGGVDEYLDWAAPDYARLYKYTRDRHYLDVTRILLFDTKSMLALPGRTWDLLGPGWQQEHWSMGVRRGVGAHRSWLPWVSVNHLHSITGLEDFDPALYRQLAKQN